MLLAGGAFLTNFKKAAPPSVPIAAVADENVASIARALDWFCQNQEPDGSWNAEKWGVDEEVAARRAARLVYFQAAVRILKELNPE
jgi:chaperone required for assembly of F1-ATPase